MIVANPIGGKEPVSELPPNEGYFRSGMDGAHGQPLLKREFARALVGKSANDWRRRTREERNRCTRGPGFLVADFQERLEADEDWGVDSIFPEEMPRYSARAVEAQRAQQSESSGPADVSSAHQAPSKPVAKPAEVRQDKTLSLRCPRRPLPCLRAKPCRSGNNRRVTRRNVPNPTAPSPTPNGDRSGTGCRGNPSISHLRSPRGGRTPVCPNDPWECNDVLGLREKQPGVRRGKSTCTADVHR